MVIGNWLLENSYWKMVIGKWLIEIGYWILVDTEHVEVLLGNGYWKWLLEILIT